MPVPEGLKEMLTVQLEPTANGLPVQLSLSRNSALSLLPKGPIVRGALLVFVKVTGTAMLFVLTNWPGKLKARGAISRPAKVRGLNCRSAKTAQFVAASPTRSGMHSNGVVRHG